MRRVTDRRRIDVPSGAGQGFREAHSGQDSAGGRTTVALPHGDVVDVDRQEVPVADPGAGSLSAAPYGRVMISRL
jgi:hypothetical protein